MYTTKVFPLVVMNQHGLPVDLVAAYIFERTQELLDELKYDGIYRDDGILVFQGKKTTAELEDRLVTFQEEAKNLLGEKFLKFTMDIWDPDATLLPPSDATRDSKTITINKKEGFPYLDMELYWRGNELQFRVHLKPGQNIKYLNKGSAHTQHTFKAIPSGNSHFSQF